MPSAQRCVGSGNFPGHFGEGGKSCKVGSSCTIRNLGRWKGYSRSNLPFSHVVSGCLPSLWVWHSAHRLYRSLLVPQACPLWVKPLRTDSRQALGLSSFLCDPSSSYLVVILPDQTIAVMGAHVLEGWDSGLWGRVKGEHVSWCSEDLTWEEGELMEGETERGGSSRDRNRDGEEKT